jgi:hypothetical protein
MLKEKYLVSSCIEYIYYTIKCTYIAVIYIEREIDM